jgi:hypothetical protein
MGLLLRTLLICLLTVTLPLKGMAAVSMLACGEHTPLAAQESHAQGAPASEHANGSAHSGHAGHAVQPHHEHAAPVDVPEPAFGSDEADVTDHADHRHHGDAAKTKCGTCAPCCAAAAPGFAGPALVHAERATRALSLEDPPFSGVTVALLHRPPISPVV